MAVMIVALRSSVPCTEVSRDEFEYVWTSRSDDFRRRLRWVYTVRGPLEELRDGPFLILASGLLSSIILKDTSLD